jgi:pimeloyl-ACP methyl ester carboxylesterase
VNDAVSRNRPAVVLLHAFPLDERMWDAQREVLAGFDVVAPNLYRLGGSSVDEWAQAILAQTRGPLVAVGASMGGYCALAMARRAPDRVEGLLLAGSRAAADSPERRRTREETIRTLRELGVEAWNPDVAAERTAEELIRATEALRDRADATDVVASFGGPLVLVVGDADELLPVDEARVIASYARDGRLEVVPGAGHFVSLDQPERFNAVLSDYVARWT